MNANTQQSVAVHELGDEISVLSILSLNHKLDLKKFGGRKNGENTKWRKKRFFIYFLLFYRQKSDHTNSVYQNVEYIFRSDVWIPNLMPVLKFRYLKNHKEAIVNSIYSSVFHSFSNITIFTFKWREFNLFKWKTLAILVLILAMRYEIK